MWNYCYCCYTHTHQYTHTPVQEHTHTHTQVQDCGVKNPGGIPTTEGQKRTEAQRESARLTASRLRHSAHAWRTAARGRPRAARPLYLLPARSPPVAPPASREGGSRGVHLWGSGSGRPRDAAVADFKLGDWLSGHFGAERSAFLFWRLGRAESCGRVESAAQRTRTVSLLTALRGRGLAPHELGPLLLSSRFPRVGVAAPVPWLLTGWGCRSCPLASQGLGTPPPLPWAPTGWGPRPLSPLLRRPAGTSSPSHSKPQRESRASFLRPTCPTPRIPFPEEEIVSWIFPSLGC